MIVSICVEKRTSWLLLSCWKPIKLVVFDQRKLWNHLNLVIWIRLSFERRQILCFFKIIPIGINPLAVSRDKYYVQCTFVRFSNKNLIEEIVLCVVVLFAETVRNEKCWKRQRVLDSHSWLYTFWSSKTNLLETTSKVITGVIPVPQFQVIDEQRSFVVYS